MIQTKLEQENKAHPLMQVYDLLHTFCMRLELEVLREHAIQLERANFNYVRVRRHEDGSMLEISYWQPSKMLENRPGERGDIKRSAEIFLKFF